MAEEKQGKLNKNLYLPVWIIEMLDVEGDRYGGPGVVAATAINAFCKANNTQKRTMLRTFRQAEIDRIYNADNIVDAAEAEVKATSKKGHRRSSKSA